MMTQHKIDPYLAEVWNVPAIRNVAEDAHGAIEPGSYWSNAQGRWMKLQCFCKARFSEEYQLDEHLAQFPEECPLCGLFGTTSPHHDCIMHEKMQDDLVPA